jgi:hypothetical protein
LCFFGGPNAKIIKHVGAAGFCHDAAIALLGDHKARTGSDQRGRR